MGSWSELSYFHFPGFCPMDGVPDDVGGGRFPPPDGRAWLPTHQMPGVQRPVSRWKDEPKLREEKGREGTGIIPSAWSPGSMSSLPSGVCVLSSESRWGCWDLPRAATTALTANGERYRPRGVYRGDNGVSKGPSDDDDRRNRRGR